MSLFSWKIIDIKSKFARGLPTSPQIFKILLLEMTCEIFAISPNLANFDLKSIIFHEKNQTFLDFFINSVWVYIWIKYRL